MNMRIKTALSVIGAAMTAVSVTGIVVTLTQSAESGPATNKLGVVVINQGSDGGGRVGPDSGPGPTGPTGRDE